MEFVDVPVPDALNGYVANIVGFYEFGLPFALRSVTPSLTIPVILVLGHGYTQHESATDTPARELSRSFVAGLTQQVAHIGSDGWSVCIQVNLTPAGAFKLLRCHMTDLTGEIADLQDLVGPFANELEQRLMELNDWPTRFEMVLHFLQQRILDGPDVSAYVDHAFTLIKQTRGDIRVQSVADKLGISRKHLVTLFAREVGMTPKQVMRVARFERALLLIQASSLSLADIAIETGYADQSHLNHEVLEFAGLPPASLKPR
jgi:AraC-like DNA-binding protein